MPENLGIEKSKEFVTSTTNAVTAIAGALKDGFQISDLLTAAGQSGNINSAIKAWPQLKLEAKDYSKEERKALVDHFKTTFNIENEKAEAFVEHVIDYGNRTFDHVKEGIELYNEFLALKAPAEEPPVV